MVEVSIWMADYRPQWIGYINSDRQLVAVAPNGEGSTTVTYPNVTYQDYHFPPRGPDDKLAVTWTDKTGMIGTAVFVPGTQTQFNALLAAWQQQLYAVAPCAVGVQGHDATIVFTGTNAHAWCASVGVSQDMQPRTVASTTNMDQLCTVQVAGSLATVRDTGGHDYGNGLCSDLRLLGDMPPSAWQPSVTTADAVSSLAQDAQRLESLSQELGKYPSREQTIINTMEQHLQKEQKDAAVRPMTSYQASGVVSYDYSGTLSYDYSGTLSNERVNLTSTVSNLDAVLSDGNKHLTIAQQSSSAAAKVAGHPIDYAQTAIAAYQTIASNAQNQKTQALATDADVSKTAQDIMTQGKAVLDAALAAVQH